MQNLSVQWKSPENKHKFLLRTLHLYEDQKEVLKKVRSKRLYLKSIKMMQSFKFKKSLQLDPKTFNFVTKFDINVIVKGYYISILKKAKNLRKFQFCFDTKYAKQCLRRLPKRLQDFDFFSRYSYFPTWIMLPLYRSIASLPNLRALRSRSFTFLKQEIQKEYKLISKYISRLKNLDHVPYRIDASPTGLSGFQALLKQGLGSPYITSLTLNIYGCSLISWARAKTIFKQETNTVSDEDANQLLDVQGEGDEITKTEIDWFFRYDLFPNLKKLNITLEDDCIYPLNPCIIEGFKAAQKLEQVTIKIACRPVGTGLIFEGLQYLPLLKTFRLGITFLRDKERRLLLEFLQKQDQLISLSLSVFKPETHETGFRSQNEFLENIWKCLNNKSHLRYLDLRSDFWPIENISNGLKQVSMVNQLQEICIQATDTLSQNSPAERVSGLCQLLTQQSQSIKRLTLILYNTISGDIVNDIIDAILELKELEELILDVRFSYENLTGVPSQEFSLNYLYSRLIMVIPALKRLWNLRLALTTISKTVKPLPENFFRLLKAFSEMQSLRILDMSLPIRKTDEESKEEIIEIAHQFSNMKMISISTFNEHDEYKIGIILEEIMHRNALKHELMF